MTRMPCTSTSPTGRWAVHEAATALLRPWAGWWLHSQHHPLPGLRWPSPYWCMACCVDSHALLHAAFGTFSARRSSLRARVWAALRRAARARPWCAACRARDWRWTRSWSGPASRCGTVLGCRAGLQPACGPSKARGWQSDGVSCSPVVSHAPTQCVRNTPIAHVVPLAAY